MATTEARPRRWPESVTIASALLGSLVEQRDRGAVAGDLDARVRDVPAHKPQGGTGRRGDGEIGAETASVPLTGKHGDRAVGAQVVVFEALLPAS